MTTNDNEFIVYRMLSLFLVLRLWVYPMPSFEIILVGIDLFTLHCLSHLIHVLNLPSYLDLSLFLHLSHNVPPCRRNLPKLNHSIFTLTLLPRLAVIIIFFSRIYIHFDSFISSNTFNMSIYLIHYKFVSLWRYSKRIFSQIRCRLTAPSFMAAKSYRLYALCFLGSLFALKTFIGLSFPSRRLRFPLSNNTK